MKRIVEVIKCAIKKKARKGEFPLAEVEVA
jgi:hypothetical protein